MDGTLVLWPDQKGCPFALDKRDFLRFMRSGFKLAIRIARAKFDALTADEINWVEELRAADNSAVLGQLRVLLLNGLRVALRDRGNVGMADLEDFTQDALLRILNRLDQFSGRSKFTTWAHSVAVNVALTELRRKRWGDVSLEQFIEEGKHFAEALALTPDHGNDEQREKLVAALRQAVVEKLSEKQRAIIAAALAGQPFDQTVALLGTNRNAAYKLLHDARRTLKHHLMDAGISLELVRTTFVT